MTKVFYWSPFVSKIATPKAVINSAISVKKYSKGKIEPSIINLFNEWDCYFKDISENNLNVYNLFKIKKNIKLPDNGFLQSRFSFFLIFILSFFPLLRLLKKYKPEYLIIHLNTSLPLFLLLIIKFNTKFILRISGKPRLNFLRKYLWKKISKRIYKVTTPTKSIYLELINNKIFDKNKLEVLYDPIINVEKFKNKDKKFIEEKNNYLLAAGRLTKQKNFKFLIECFEKIYKNNKNLSLIILGEGDEKKYLEKIILEKQLDKKILLAGYKENILDYMRNSFCFVLSSLWEDPGFVLFEAGMTNTIILSSNCETGPKDLLENKVNSFVFESDNSESFINSFNELKNLNEFKKKQIKINMKKSLKKFTLFEHYKKIKTILI